MSKNKVAILGDWPEGLKQVSQALKKADLEEMPVALADIKTMLKKRAVDALVFCLPEYTSEILSRINEVRILNDSIPLVFLVKNITVEQAVHIIKTGATDALVSPLNGEKFSDRLGREIRLYELASKVFATSTPVEEYSFENMIGHSKAMQENYRMIEAVAKSNATVLITGESGAGKELVAKAIHKRSERNENRFVDINCGAIPRELLENELFGHEKGAFTGAHKRYQGSFETAHKGTLFLDEISEMDPMLQVKILRALQERMISRIGSAENIKVDVRIVAATNRNLAQLIESGKFREDLFYRLNVVNIDIPSLRERREDIPLLAKHFLDFYSAKNNKIFLDFANDAMEAMINYDWPGNVRELENTIERIVVLNDSSQVKIKYLPKHLQKVDCSIAYAGDLQTVPEDAQILSLEELERRAIEAALMKFQGSISVAAKKLKIGQATLYRKVKKFGLQV